jgi:hypothetical protein
MNDANSDDAAGEEKAQRTSSRADTHSDVVSIIVVLIFAVAALATLPGLPA